MFEMFEHTADLGLRVRAADLNTLFVEAGQALFTVIVENPATVEPRQRVELEMQADAYDLLLFDWLNALLFRFDAEHLLFGTFKVQINEMRVRGVAWGEPLDHSRHELNHEVKAITYHGLRVEQTSGGWLAEVIVDI